jgi:hypothetical protein
MNRLTPDERAQAQKLGNQLIDLLTSTTPLIAGFALASVLRSMPPTVLEPLNAAKQLIQRAMDWQRTHSN